MRRIVPLMLHDIVPAVALPTIATCRLTYAALVKVKHPL